MPSAESSCAKTSQPLSGDYIIKRKRRRPIDPCLGFYLPFSPPGLNISNTIAPCKRSINEKEVLTVDAFLRKTPFIQKTYGKRNRMHAIEPNVEPVQKSPFSSSSHDAAEWDSGTSDTEPPSSTPCRPKKRIRKKKQTKSLAERLYEAAVLTRADPTDELAASEPSSSRCALKFVPEDKYTTPVHKRSMTLVDPRRVVPFRPCSFYPTREEFSKKRTSKQPVNDWRKPHNTRNFAPRLRSKHITRRRKTENLRRSALMFIPFEEAETLYSAIRRSAKQPPSTIKASDIMAVQSHHSSSTTISCTSGKENTDSTHTTNTTPQSLSSPQALALVLRTPNRKTFDPTQAQNLGLQSPPALDLQLVTQASPSKRRFKPLGSFFDEFRQNLAQTERLGFGKDDTKL